MTVDELLFKAIVERSARARNAEAFRFGIAEGVEGAGFEFESSDVPIEYDGPHRFMLRIIVRNPGCCVGMSTFDLSRRAYELHLLDEDRARAFGLMLGRSTVAQLRAKGDPCHAENAQ